MWCRYYLGSQKNYELSNFPGRFEGAIVRGQTFTFFMNPIDLSCIPANNGAKVTSG